jgi:hypothetical protein
MYGLLNRLVQQIKVSPSPVYGKHVLNQFPGYDQCRPIPVAASQLFFMKLRQLPVPVGGKFSGLDQFGLQVFVPLF